VEELALAEDRLSGGVEPVVVQLDERAPEERETVEHLPSGEDDAGIAREPEVASYLRVLLGASKGQPELRPPCDPLEDRHAEVADVPAGEDVRIGRPEMAEEGLDARPLARHEPPGHAPGESRQGASLTGSDHPDVIAAVPRRRDRIE